GGLLNNAVKFSPEGARIKVEVNTLPEEAMVAISVWNEGSFIPSEKREHLFTPFVQLDSGLNRKHEGTGIGLVLVQRFTEMHGGRVKVESTEGKGTRFTVIFPLESVEAD
ncbi:MAG TPA: ATP-binding protein, partial [Chromatiaceae bacterium]|nr:ATP-binding protein [Chromatiaceae bacterium]